MYTTSVQEIGTASYKGEGMMKAIAICRVSSKKQEENNHSLQQQGTSVGDMANELSAEIVMTWSMATSSKKGVNLKRKDLNGALKYCKYNKSVKYLFIDKVSRFARELKMIFYYMVEFEQLGVKVVFCHPSQRRFNADTADAMYELAKKAHQAESENEERTETSITKMQARVAQGYYPFYPHQGYKKTALEDGLHIPDYPRYGLLQKALKATSSFDMTIPEAVQWLFANGYRTPTILRKNECGIRVQKGNRKLDADHFRTIMEDCYYAGILQVGNWPINEHGLHQAMITVEEWETNVAIIKNRKKRVKQQFNPNFRMNKALHLPCQHKDGKLTGINHGNGKGWWREEYVCRACKKRVAKDLVHDSVNDVLERIRPSQNALKELGDALDKVWRNNEAYRLQRSKELSERKAGLQQRKSELITTIVAYPDIADDIKEEIVKVKASIAEADLQIAESDNMDDDYREFVTYALNYSENLRSKWWELPKDSLEKCKQLLFSDEILVAQDGKVYTPALSPIYTLLDNKKAPESPSDALMVELPGTAPGSASLSWLVFYRHRLFQILGHYVIKITKGHNV
ncbi:MAG: hypothetical protein NVSMB46_04470 [Candidatus Saccharimonadales bacterium]